LLLAGSAVEANAVNTDVARVVGGAGRELALDGSGTTALGVVDAIDRAGGARLDV